MQQYNPINASWLEIMFCEKGRGNDFEVEKWEKGCE